MGSKVVVVVVAIEVLKQVRNFTAIEGYAQRYLDAGPDRAETDCRADSLLQLVMKGRERSQAQIGISPPSPGQ